MITSKEIGFLTTLKGKSSLPCCFCCNKWLPCIFDASSWGALGKFSGRALALYLGVCETIVGVCETIVAVGEAIAGDPNTACRKNSRWNNLNSNPMTKLKNSKSRIDKNSLIKWQIIYLEHRMFKLKPNFETSKIAAQTISTTLGKLKFRFYFDFISKIKKLNFYW